MSNECSNQLVVTGLDWILAQFRRDACYDNLHHEDNVTLSLGKLFPLRRFRDQEDATRFLGCDRIGKASVKVVKQDKAEYSSLEFHFTADQAPLLRFIRMVSILFPRLAFNLKTFEEGGAVRIVRYMSGISSDDKCDCDDDYDDYDDEDEGRTRFFVYIPVPPHPASPQNPHKKIHTGKVSS